MARHDALRWLCLTAVAGATSDSAPCASLAEPRDAFKCVMAAAMHASNADVCAPFLDIAAREAACADGGVARERCAIWRSFGARAATACKAVATGDAPACEALPAREDSSRETCIHHLAVRNKIASLCALLHEADDPQNMAENECLADVGVATKSATECARIPHGKANPALDVDYEICLMAAASKDHATCAHLPSDGIKEHDVAARRQCAFAIATPCPEIGVEACVTHWQMSIADTSLCDGSSWDRDGDGCALTVALNTGNARACDAIADESMKSTCAKLVAR